MTDQGYCSKSGVFLEIDPEAGRIEAIRIAARSDQDEAVVLDLFVNICKPDCWECIRRQCKLSDDLEGRSTIKAAVMREKAWSTVSNLVSGCE